MRFFSKGPSIPDDLLNARDEGRVIFFCGAGVSRARAGLSDFFGLAKKVVDSLGAPSENDTRKILTESQHIYNRTGISGLISADQVFRLLEQDFLSSDIERAVAQALKPQEPVNHSAHKIILDLAKTPTGKVRLITTNFDRLFEDSDTTLKIWQPPRLPNPSHSWEMDGIIHLHGYVNKDYSGCQGDGFILSSSEFGRAYLAEGWATTFIRQVLDQYMVVFVGYTADDPPVQYLLEGLNKQVGHLEGVYAFQAGIEDEASSKWKHKGVQAISYFDEDNHKALWNTLEAWAKRANNPDDWHESIIEMARKGPEELQPHERGQVAHIVSSLEGMKKFSSVPNPPPADWLCVFDPLRRFEAPGYQWDKDLRRHFTDPFEAYGLDSDQIPKKLDLEDHYTSRELPANCWDCFAINPKDRKNLQESHFTTLRGRWSTEIPNLPARLRQLGIWIARVAYQPAAVWWAVRQNGLHPQIQKLILFEIGKAGSNISTVVRQAWYYLFDTYEEGRRDYEDDWYDLKSTIRETGWNLSICRKFSKINSPFLGVKKEYLRNLKPPPINVEIVLTDLINLEVAYPQENRDEKVPEEWLEHLIKEFRKGLETALLLETEVGSYKSLRISPIVPENHGSIDSHYRSKGLSGYLLFFISLFERLVHHNSFAARKEFLAWPENDEKIFSRLRIWACGHEQLVSHQEFPEVISSFNDTVFWDSHHQRDLLLVLAKRWETLEETSKKMIEKRLLQGRKKWKNEEDSEFIRFRSVGILNRISWMSENGCRFTFNFDDTVKTLQKDVPSWSPSYAKNAISSIEPRGGIVQTDTNYSSLLNIPLEGILKKAQEIGGRTDDFLVENAPFAGLSKDRPLLAFRTLTQAGKNNEFPIWAWQTFLRPQSRESDKPKLSALIAKRLTSYPNERVADFIFAASDWLMTVEEKFSSQYLNAFDNLISKFLEILKTHPSSGTSGVQRKIGEIDWAMEALNAPVGKIAQTLMKDPRNKEEKLPLEWVSHITALLRLPGDLRRHALVIFSHCLIWFFTKDPDWTQSNLLSVFEKPDIEDQNAVLSGFLWRAQTPPHGLYEQLKPYLIQASKKQILKDDGYIETLAGILLIGWGSPKKDSQERHITNQELRDIILNSSEGFRAGILWNLEGLSKEKAEWADLLEELLGNVWPRQISVRSSNLSSMLFDLIFEAPNRFSTRSDIILPLLTKIESNRLRISDLLNTENTIINKYPEKVLTILHTVLPENVAFWPFQIEDVFRKISEVDSKLKYDERLIELFQKWNAR